MIILGPEELKNGVVKIRMTSDRSEELVELPNLLKAVQSKLQILDLSDKIETLN